MATILIVDDDAALREGLAETVADLGHRPVGASNGRMALAIAGRESIDAILLNLRIPGMDGLEILRQLREIPSPAPGLCERKQYDRGDAPWSIRSSDEAGWTR